MKKHMTFLSWLLPCSLLLIGCGRTVPPAADADSPSPPAEANMFSDTLDGQTDAENTLDSIRPTEQSAADTSAGADQNAACGLPLSTADTAVEQGGPYGKLSLSIPANWRYETCPMDSGIQQAGGLYGIRFYPQDAAEGYIDIAYFDSFGVCGTGLSEENTTIAGRPASIGTYDQHAHWDFIAFRDDYAGIVALTYAVDDWWEACAQQVTDILDTLSYDTADREGGAYVYSAEFEADRIGLNFALKKISPAGATLVFHQYDEKAPTGNLEYGTDFVLEIQKEDVWEQVPVISDSYAFDDAAHSISKRDTTEQELDWTWLYGTLDPGVYRIKKEIVDFRDTGDYDRHTVYAQFFLN